MFVSRNSSSVATTKRESSTIFGTSVALIDSRRPVLLRFCVSDTGEKNSQQWLAGSIPAVKRLVLQYE